MYSNSSFRGKRSLLRCSEQLTVCRSGLSQPDIFSDLQRIKSSTGRTTEENQDSPKSRLHASHALTAPCHKGRSARNDCRFSCPAETFCTREPPERKRRSSIVKVLFRFNWVLNGCVVEEEVSIRWDHGRRSGVQPSGPLENTVISIDDVRPELCFIASLGGKHDEHERTRCVTEMVSDSGAEWAGTRGRTQSPPTFLPPPL